MKMPSTLEPGNVKSDDSLMVKSAVLSGLHEKSDRTKGATISNLLKNIG